MNRKLQYALPENWLNFLFFFFFFLSPLPRRFCKENLPEKLFFGGKCKK